MNIIGYVNKSNLVIISHVNVIESNITTKSWSTRNRTTISCEQPKQNKSSSRSSVNIIGIKPYRNQICFI